MPNIFLTILFILICSISHATEQVIFNGVSDPTPASSTNYQTVMGATGHLWSGAEDEYAMPVPVAGVFKNLRVFMATPPGAGEAITWTLRNAGASTALSCVVSGTEKYCEDSDDAVSVAAGSPVNIMVNPATAGTGQSFTGWSMVFAPNTNNYTILMGGSAGTTQTNAADRYLPVHGNFNASTVDESDVQAVMPTSGTFRNLYVTQHSDSGTGDGFTYTLRKNAADTAVACTISGNSATSCNDTTNTFTVTAGDLVDLEIHISSGSPGAKRVYLGVVFEPSQVGEFLVPYTTNTGLLNSGVTYHNLSAGLGIGTASTGVEFSAGQRVVFTGMRVQVDTDPGAGTAYTFNILKGTSLLNTAGFSCTVSGTANSCSATGTFSVSYDSIVGFSVTPANTPSTGGDVSVTAVGHMKRTLLMD